MYNVSNASSPSLTNCTFSNNSAISTGGAGANGNGGGIYNAGEGVALIGCTFTGNSAGGVSSGGGRLGGAIYNDDVAGMTLTDCTFTANTADVNGGGIYNLNSSPMVTDCMFTENVAVLGSGMCNIGGPSDPTVTNCSFLGNITGVSGGIYNDNGDPAITNCIFSGNTASSFGGAVFNLHNADPVIKNCTFSQNQAFAGASIYNFSTTSNPRITNCIVWGNSNVAGVSVDGDGTPIIRFSNIEGGFAGIGNIEADPLFVDAAGPDSTPGTADDNLRLLSGSPSMDTGNNAALPADTADLDGDGNVGEAVPFDLDGNDRILDGDGNRIATVDMGAYEFDPACPTDVNGDGVTNVLDLIDLLRCFDLPADPGCEDEDVNGDRIVDHLDLIDLLLAFGTSCP